MEKERVQEKAILQAVIAESEARIAEISRTSSTQRFDFLFNQLFAISDSVPKPSATEEKIIEQSKTSSRSKKKTGDLVTPTKVIIVNNEKINYFELSFKLFVPTQKPYQPSISAEWIVCKVEKSGIVKQVAHIESLNRKTLERLEALPEIEKLKPAELREMAKAYNDLYGLESSFEEYLKAEPQTSPNLD